MIYEKIARINKKFRERASYEKSQIERIDGQIESLKKTIEFLESEKDGLYDERKKIDDKILEKHRKIYLEEGEVCPV